MTKNVNVYGNYWNMEKMSFQIYEYKEILNNGFCVMMEHIKIIIIKLSVHILDNGIGTNANWLNIFQITSTSLIHIHKM